MKNRVQERGALATRAAVLVAVGLMACLAAIAGMSLLLSPEEIPKVQPVDIVIPQETERERAERQADMEDAGWERVDRQGKLFWKNPQSGRLYPQGAAVQRLQEITASEESEGDS